MGLALSEEHRALSDAARGWAARAAAGAPRAAAGSADSGAASYRDSLRPGLAGQGLLGLHLPESCGGQGYGLPELAVAVAELGRTLLPGAYLPTVLASAVLAAGDGPGTLLAGLADGTLNGAVALGEGARVTREAPDAVAVDGACGLALGARDADLVILPATGPDGEVWVAVDAADLSSAAAESLDLTRSLARVHARGARVPADRVLAGVTRATVTSLAATLLGAEACGIADWAVATAAEHARNRRQFGRPIGQFQAVKHRCAWMLTAAEQAAATVWDAARAHGVPGSPAGGADAQQQELAAASAAVVAVDAALTCAHECIQVLGGIGYTWEHDAHLYYRRALSLRAALGPGAPWARRAARLALAGARRPAAVDLPAEAEPTRARVAGELAAITAADPAERSRLLADGGWVTPHLPRPWGRDADALEQIVISRELRAAGLRPPGLAIGAWVVPALAQHGTAEQQRRFLPATLRGEIVWCQLFSEPGAGSDLAGLSTKAERVGGGWRLTGQKIWTSLAKHASWGICLARSDPAAPRHEGITYFLVDMSAPGLEVRPLREMTGDALFNEVFLDGVFVPDERVVGEPGGGWRVARTTLAGERVSLSQSWTFGCGVPELLDTMAGLGPEPDPALLERAGRLVCEGHAIDMLGVRLTLQQLSGEDRGATGSIRKLLGMRHAQRVAEACWTASGPEGAVADSPWAKPVLFSRALTIGGGTTDIQLNIIGERILGLPRDPAPGE